MAKRMNFFIPLVLTICMLTGCFSSSSNSSVSTPKPDVYYMFVGINNYKNISSLNFAVNDAKDYANLFHQQDIALKSITLINSAATKENIQVQMNKLLKGSRPEDTFVFTFSGHGHSSSTKEFLVPYDAIWIPNQKEPVEATLISDTDFKNWIQSIVPENCIFIIDSCYSAGMIKSRETVRPFLSSMNRSFRNLEEVTGKNIIAMSACQEDELASEGTGPEDYPLRFQNGRFTDVLIEGMTQRNSLYPADINPSDGLITVQEAYRYAYDKILNNYPYLNQEPYIYPSLASPLNKKVLFKCPV